MDYLIKAGWVLWTIFLCLIASWLALWAGNIVTYILSFVAGWLDVLLGEMLTGVAEFIYLLLTFGIVYFFLFLFLFGFITRSEGSIMNEVPITAISTVVVVALLLICTCDVRLDSIMPDFCLSGIEYLRNECNAFVLSPIDWANGDFGGSALSSMQQNVVDTSIGLACVVSFVFNPWNRF